MSTPLVLNYSSPDNKKALLNRSLNRRQPQVNPSAFNRTQSLLNSSIIDRRQMLLAEQELWSSSAPQARGNRRFNEVAGGATAGVAAIACCAPLSIAELLVLAMYRVPTGLCRKALRHKRRRRLIKNGNLYLTPAGHEPMCDWDYCDDMVLEFQTGDPVIMAEAMEKDDDMMQLEKEMWDKFYGAGFWRTTSLSRPVSFSL